MTFFKKTFFRLIVIGLLVYLPVAGFLACTGPSKIESPGEDKSEEKGPDEEATPPISLPAPPLPLIKNEKILIATMDSESRNPVIAFPGAIDVSEMNDADGDGYVDDVRMVVAPETSEETDLASLHSCPIKTDGSAECYPVGDNGTTYCVYLTDGTNKLTEPFCEDPNVNVVWNGKPVKDIVKAPDHPYLGSTYHVLTDTHISTISKSDDPEDPAMIWGDFANSYKHAETYEDTRELAFDSAIDTLATRILTEGISLWTSEYDPGSLSGTLLEGLDVSIIDSGELTTLFGTKEYTQIKYASDGKLRFSRRPNGFAYNEWIYIHNTPGAVRSAQDIQFLTRDEILGVGVKKTNAFDVVDGGIGIRNIAIVAWEGVEDGGTERGHMIRMANRALSVEMGGEIPLPHDGNPDTVDYDFKDLIIYQQSGDDPVEDLGRALLVDAHNNAVWIISYFLDHIAPWSDHYIQDTLNPDTDAISVGPNPQSVVMNADKSKAYVVCQNGEEVYELTLKEGGVLKTVAEINNTANHLKKVINLRDLIPGKDLTIKPNEITLSGDNLLIGTEDLRSAMVVPLTF